MSGYCHTIDPTRKVTLAHDQIAAEPYSARDAFMDKIDVVGYNYVGRWRERAELLYDADREEHLDRCVIGTENPSAGYIRSDYNFEVDPGSFWNKPYYTAAVTVGKLLRYTMVHDFVAGDYMWTGIDYLGEAHGWPIHGSSAGLMDLAGFEKPGFYRRKAFWSTEPFACILTRPDDGDEHEWRPWNAHWNYTDGENVVVRVFTNVQKETISLSIVGIDGEKSLHDGTYLEKEGCTEWRFAYEPGVLKAVCGEAECSIQTAGKAVELSANVWHAEETINKEEVMQIEVSLTDENGVLAAEDLEITAEVIGGTLLGLENGDLADLTPYCESHRKTHNGRLIVYVKPKEDVKVCISCPALDKRVWIEQ